MSNPKVVAVLLIVCEQDSLNDPKETVSKVGMEYDLPQIKVEGTNYAIDSFIHEESKRVRFGWHTRDKPSIRKISDGKSTGTASGAGAFKDNLISI